MKLNTYKTWTLKFTNSKAIEFQMARWFNAKRFSIKREVKELIVTLFYYEFKMSFLTKKYWDNEAREWKFK